MSSERIPEKKILDRVAVALALILACGSMAVAFVGLPEPRDYATLESFAVAFERLFSRQRLVFFPLGVATSILVIVVLLRHSQFLSWRGGLQILGIVSLFVSGFSSGAAGEPIVDAVMKAARAGRAEEIGPLLDRLTIFVTVSLVSTVLAAASLVVAQRMPLPPVAATASLTPRHRSLLFLVGAATLFEGYDRFIAALALPYIGRDLGASEGTLAAALSAIRVGALASIPLGRLADRHGRRRLLLFTILAYTVATAATGLSRGVLDFVGYQLFATIFLTAELAVAQVVISEEFPATFRARGQGFLGAFAALGAGLAALLFPIFQETALGWRGLYFLGILPLLLVAYMRRQLPETERWQRAHSAGETERFAFSEFLAPGLRVRFLVLLLVSMAGWGAASPAFAFASFRATREFGWTPSQVSTMIILGGGIGMAGWVVFGGLAERLGRKPVGMVALVGVGAAVVGYYRTDWLMLSFGSLVFMEAGTSVAVNALGTELFPTRMRSTAKSWIINASIVGALLGLAVVGALADRVGGADRVLTFLALVPVAACPSLLLLPEPRGRELEELVPA